MGCAGAALVTPGPAAVPRVLGWLWRHRAGCCPPPPSAKITSQADIQASGQAGADMGTVFPVPRGIICKFHIAH